MGGRGSGGSRNSGRNKSPQQKLEGKRVDSLDITTKNVEEQLGLEPNSTTASQKATLVSMFNGMKEYDRSYDDNKTPFKVQKIQISQPSLHDPVIPSKALSVLVVTTGDSGRPVVDAMDTKYRQFIIGTGGGAYTYSDKGKRKTVSSFDIRYGSSD